MNYFDMVFMLLVRQPVLCSCPSAGVILCPSGNPSHYVAGRKIKGKENKVYFNVGNCLQKNDGAAINDQSYFQVFSIQSVFFLSLFQFLSVSFSFSFSFSPSFFDNSRIDFLIIVRRFASCYPQSIKSKQEHDKNRSDRK